MRRDGWERILYEFLDSRRMMPFEWGRNDCAMFAADWVMIATGHDPAAEWRGTYSDASIMRQMKGNRLAKLVSDKFDECAVMEAHRGDIGLVAPSGSIQMPALCVIDTLAVFGPGSDGLVSLPRSALMRAWRVE